MAAANSMQRGGASVPALLGASAVLAAALVGGAWAAPGDGVAVSVRAFQDSLRSGEPGPEMVVVPAGRFRMGCNREGRRRCGREVSFRSAFAMSRYEVTFEDYDRFAEAKGGARHDEAVDHGWGRGRRPVIHVARSDALAYAAWLSSQTGARYRLPSEAEWEYAARAGTATKWLWGDEFVAGLANCAECGTRWDNDRTAPVGSFPPNAWGLHDMAGNVYEMTLDCWRKSYRNMPADGSARTEPTRESDPDENGNCRRHTARGGSWLMHVRPWRAWTVGSTVKISTRVDQITAYLGIRLVRELADSAAEGGPGAAVGASTVGAPRAGG